MPAVKAIISRAEEVASGDPALQMQVIRKIMEDIYGGTWGVLVIKDPSFVSDQIHWTIPDFKHLDNSPAFCLHVHKSWQYNVFKTGNVDTDSRITVEQVIRGITDQKVAPQPISDIDFAHKLGNAFSRRKLFRFSEDR
uniref:Dynein light chain n=1 Tax=Rhabditophanes sp. KR3021 TaxID=114890 RepID=A0AC35TJL6_9BILA